MARNLLMCLALIVCLGTTECALKKFMGCYRDRPEPNRAMKGFAAKGRRSLTINGCADYCKSINFEYAGVEFLNTVNDIMKNWEIGKFLECINDDDTSSYFDGHLLWWSRDYFFSVNITEKLGDNLWKKIYEYGRECYCDNNDYGRYGRVRDFECNSPCSGNTKYRCGGTWRVAVFSTADYVGCFVDKRDRALKGKLIRARDMTNKKCRGICKAGKFKYAGTQYSFECFCGNKELPYGQVSQKECNRPCGGDRNDECGGTWRLSVYKV